MYIFGSLTGASLIMKFLHTFCFYMSCFLYLGARAQEPYPSFRNYDAEDGLPSSEIYQVKQDSKGYIWFATNNGVSRFNGYEFKNFSISDGLPDNTVFNIYEDSKGRIWFLPLSNKLSYYYEGKIYLYKYNQLILETLKKNRIKTSFCVDEKGTVFLGLEHYGICEVNESGHVRTYPGSGLKDKGMAVYEPIKGVLSFANINRNAEDLIVREDSSITFHTGSFSGTVFMDERTSNLQPNPFFTVLKNGDIAASLSNKLYMFDKQGHYISYRFGYRILWIYEDQEGDLWIGTYLGGVFHVKDRDFSEKKHYLGDYTVTGVLEDKDKGFWFTTEGNSVFYTSSKFTLTFDEQSGLEGNRINCLKVGKDGLYAGLSRGTIRKINSSERLTDFKIRLSTAPADEIKAMYYDSLSSELIFSSEGNMWYASHDKAKVIPLAGSFYKMLPDGTSGYWYCYGIGLGRIVGHRNDMGFKGRPRFQRTNSLVMKSPNLLLLGCPNGLWQYDILNNTYEFAGGEEPLLHQRILDLAYTKDSILCIATKGAGLLMMWDKKIVQINKTKGLSSDNIKKIFLEDTLIWAVTDKGLNRITISKDGLLKGIRVYSTYDGLASNELYDVVRFGDKIWVATDKGLSFFDPERTLPHAQQSPIYIDALWINEKATGLTANYKLEYFENHIRIRYIALEYKQPGMLQYRYRMEGLDSSWIYTENREVQYTTLPSGHYRFLVSVLSKDGSWSTNPATCSFEIRLPFWKTWWFMTLTVIVVISVLYLGISYRIRKKQTATYREKETQRVLLGLKLKALRAQMNPHFIFNVMNSIQHFIVYRNDEAAQHYLSKFARLIRSTLNNSDRNTVPLADEISVLELYLDLEKMRFDKEVTYHISLSSDIDPACVEIPSMLIQPYVENAMKHGLLPASGAGKVGIDISRKGCHLKCTIEDNGVGRTASSRNKNPDYRSFGTSITRERLEVINELYEHTMPETIIDLVNDKGEPVGTRVELYIPFVET